MDWTLIVPVVAAGVRNLAGWLENSLKDGKINTYEWGQLGKTVFSVVILAVGAHLGLGTDWVSSSGLAVLGDFGLSAIKKAGNS